MIRQFVKVALTRLSLWHINRQLDELEARYVAIRADLSQHKRRSRGRR